MPYASMQRSKNTHIYIRTHERTQPCDGLSLFSYRKTDCNEAGVCLFVEEVHYTYGPHGKWFIYEKCFATKKQRNNTAT